jgi:hypothetical protein
VETKALKSWVVKVRERLGEEDPGVIHQNIDASEVFDRCFGSLHSGFLLADIAIY